MAIALFRAERMGEPLEQYLDSFKANRDSVETLLEQTEDLSLLQERATEVLSDAALQEVVRYLSGPPISSDDLKVVADASSLSPNRLAADPGTAAQVIQTVLLGLDRGRFPWLGESRAPEERERFAAAIATAALMASRRSMTFRANESKKQQEEAVKQRLREEQFREVPTGEIKTLADAPREGEFCAESLFGTRKADVVIGLWDGRKMPLECKVSNSSTNSVKRLNNDAAVKATTWTSEFGTRQVVPAAMLSGVYKTHNLLQAQERGLTLWWAHALTDLVEWIGETKPPRPQAGT